MKKKCALILSGFLRDRRNLNLLTPFLRKNSRNYSIDIYIYTYDVMGEKVKASPRDFDTAKISHRTFASIFSADKRQRWLRIEPFSQFQGFINDFIQEKDLVEMVKCEHVIQGVNSSRIKTSIEWELNKMLSQFHMNWLNIQEIKKLGEEYDVVIKSRLDLNHHALPLIPENIEEEAFYGTASKWISRTQDKIHHNKTNSFPFIRDHNYILNFKDLDSLEGAFSIESLCNRYKDGRWVKKHQLSCELNQSIGLFIEGNLKKFQPHKNRSGLNRTSKY